MKLWQDSHFRTYFYSIFASYTVIGLWGTFWVSDEFDPIRLHLTSFVTVPALCLYLVCFIEDRQYWRKWPKIFWGSAATVIVTLLWGHLILLNAIGAKEPLVLSGTYKAMLINSQAKRGAFGWIYQTRW